MQSIGDPQNRTCKSLKLGRCGYPFDGVTCKHTKCLRCRANKGQRDTDGAEDVSKIHLATLGVEVYRG